MCTPASGQSSQRAIDELAVNERLGAGLPHHRADQIVEHACVHVVYVTQAPLNASEQTAVRGFLEAANRFPRLRATVTRHDATREGICQALRPLLKGSPKPTGYLVSSPEPTLTTLGFLQSQGVRVPADASVICCIDSPFLDFHIPSVPCDRDHHGINLSTLPTLHRLTIEIRLRPQPVRRKWYKGLSLFGLSPLFQGGSMQIATDYVSFDVPMKVNTKPIHEVRLGFIKAAVWRNETEAGVRYNATFSRLYRDGDQWKSTESFGRDDLPTHHLGISANTPQPRYSRV